MATKGILGTKLGMTQVFDDEGRALPVTVVQAGPCTVAQVKTVDTDGYNAVQLAFGTRKNPKKPLKGHLSKAGLDTARVLVELRTDDEHEVGAQITADIFAPGDLVDVTGRTKGKGYTGVMKRHGFSGMGDGHGVKKKNRHPGSVGMASTPGRTLPGQRMAGRSGNAQVTVQNLEIVGVDTERNLLLVRGAVPGSNGSVLLVRSAVKAPTSTGGEA